MNWKLLSVPLLGLTLVACDSKKEEKKADETTPTDTVKVEELKDVEEAKDSAATPTEEDKNDDMIKEEPKEEKKDS